MFLDADAASPTAAATALHSASALTNTTFSLHPSTHLTPPSPCSVPLSALPGQMTGREVLRMYARLRGLPEVSVEAVAQQLLQYLGLQQYADRLVSVSVRLCACVHALLGRGLHWPEALMPGPS